MRTILRSTRVLLVLFLASAVLAQVPQDVAILSEVIALQNSQILQGIDTLSKARSDALGPNDPLRVLVRQRAEYLKKLMVADPGRALALRLSDDDRGRLLARGPDLKDAIEEMGKWNGPADVVIEDRFDLGTSRTLVWVKDRSGDMEVYLEHEVPDLVCGQQLSVDGMRIGDVIAASAATASEKGAQATNCSSKIGTHNIAVILVEFPGDPLPSFVTQSWTSSRMFATDDRSLHGFWAENSSGLAGATGDVFGPVEIAATCSTTTIRNSAVAAVDSQVNFSNYTRLLIVYPESACGFVGLGSVGCSSASTSDCGGGSCPMGVSWMTIDNNNNNRSYLAAFGSHEGGHNYGLRHASSYEYGTQPLGDLDEAGVHCEYGGVFSTMGILYGSNPVTGHYGVQHKAQLNWLTPGSGYQEVDSAGTFLVKAG